MSLGLDNLLRRLRAYENDKVPKCLEFITDIHGFIGVLEKINFLVGMERVKKQITERVGGFIVNYHLYKTPTNGEKLHTLLYGASGCGKSLIGKLLAELWSYSGCLPKDLSSPYTPSSEGLEALRGVWGRGETEDFFKISEKAKDKNISFLSERKRNEELISSTNAMVNKLRKTVRLNTQDHFTQTLFSSIKKNLKTLRTSQTPQASQTPSLFSFSPITRAPKIAHTPKFIVITKGDLIGKYQGHTTDQVRKLLSKYIGGVIMIDEAYSLLTSSGDDYGKEILTEIISFMSSHADKIIFIFAGYKDEMLALMEMQKGLSRRFNWVFEIEEYSSDELFDIFHSQLKGMGLKIDESDEKECRDFFSRNLSNFPHFGGDTENLCTTLKEILYSSLWERVLETPESVDRESIIVKPSTLEEAMKVYMKNRTDKSSMPINLNYFS